MYGRVADDGVKARIVDDRSVTCEKAGGELDLPVQRVPVVRADRRIDGRVGQREQRRAHLVQRGGDQLLLVRVVGADRVDRGDGGDLGQHLGRLACDLHPEQVTALEQAQGVRRDEAVPRTQLIQEAERPVGPGRREPQRQAGYLHGHRVDVDAVQASFRDHSLQLTQGLRPVERRIVGDPPGDERRGADEEVTAAHRRIENVQVEQSLEGVSTP